MELDLDAARLARAEKNGASKTIKLDGEVFELSPEMWVDAAEALERGEWREALRLLMGEETFARFQQHRITIPDLKLLVKGDADRPGVVGMYADDQGESSASSDS